MTLREHYRRIRAEHPTTRASDALRGAHHALELDAILRDIDWSGEYRGDGYPMRVGTIGDVEILIYADEEPYDWGDIDPTDEERDALEVIGVAVRLVGEDDPIQVKYWGGRPNEWHAYYADAAIWGVGYESGDMEREGVSVALECGWIDAARTELSERAYWAARDVATA